MRLDIDVIPIVPRDGFGLICALHENGWNTRSSPRYRRYSNNWLSVVPIAATHRSPPTCTTSCLASCSNTYGIRFTLRLRNPKFYRYYCTSAVRQNSPNSVAFGRLVLSHRWNMFFRLYVVPVPWLFLFCGWAWQEMHATVTSEPPHSSVAEADKKQHLCSSSSSSRE